MGQGAGEVSTGAALALHGKSTIAGAVAAEIRRIENHPDLARSEGAAYKGAFFRMGADPLQLCHDFEADCIIARIVTGRRRAARSLALLQAYEARP